MEESASNSGLNGASSSRPEAEQETNKKETKKVTIQRSIQLLDHACLCHDANCHLPKCEKMKRVVKHTKSCERKTHGGCPICKQLIAMCCYHSKHCQETKCPVPFCVKVKLKLKQHQLRRQLQQASLQQPVAVNNMQTSSVPTSGEGSNMSQEQQQQPGTSGGIVAGASGASGNPPGGFAVQKLAQQQMIATIKAFKKQRQAFQMAQAANQNQAANAGHGPGGVMVPNQQPQHLLQHMISQQQQQQQPGTPGGIVAGASGASGNPPGGLAVQKHALQQLLAIVKSPNTPEQQAQILQILKSNPPLMAAFIKQKQAFQMAQAANQNQAANAGQVPGGVMVPNQQPQHQLQHMISQQQQQQQQQQQLQQQPGTSGGIVASASGVDGIFPWGPGELKHSLQQLVAALDLPNTAEQQAMVLQILKSNPPLMATFIKHRQAFQIARAANQAANAGQALLQLEAVFNLPDSPDKTTQIFRLLKNYPNLQVVYKNYQRARLQMSRASKTALGGA